MYKASKRDSRRYISENIYNSGLKERKMFLDFCSVKDRLERVRPEECSLGKCVVFDLATWKFQAHVSVRITEWRHLPGGF